jgi:hypothetical protein
VTLLLAILLAIASMVGWTVESYEDGSTVIIVWQDMTNTSEAWCGITIPAFDSAGDAIEAGCWTP